MSNLTLLLIVVPVIFMLGLLLGAPRLARRFRRRQEVSAVDLFRMQREQLEAKFFDLARGRGIPRDLRWVECDWLPEVTWGRAIEDGMLTAFVGVNIRFEAIDAFDMPALLALDMSFTKIYMDLSGFSGYAALLDVLSLLNMYTYTLQPEVIVVKSRALKTFAHRCVPWRDPAHAEDKA